ncbi:RDD family protein [Sphingomonas sp. ac-8]|uniref:RDD family protein n=1 Tax=Sphingomonas sp. ac-8 TaxID=3242977 RepID=UPI003A813C2F
MARRPRTPRSPRPAPSLDRALVTPEGVTLNLRLGSAGARAGALTLDLLIMLAILIGFTLLMVLVAQATGTETGPLMLAVWLLGFFLLRNFYFVAFEAGGRAATPGKRLQKLRVVARDGGRLTPAAVLARNLMREIELFLPLTFLPFAFAEGTIDGWVGFLAFGWALLFLFFLLFNRDRMRAGDLVAGTWVVENERRQIGIELLDPDALDGDRYRFTPQELAAYGTFELHKLEEVLRRDDRHDQFMVARAIRTKLGRNPDEGYDREFLEAYYAALRLELERKLLFGRRKKDKHDREG